MILRALSVAEIRLCVDVVEHLLSLIGYVVVLIILKAKKLMEELSEIFNLGLLLIGQRSGVVNIVSRTIPNTDKRTRARADARKTQDQSVTQMSRDPRPMRRDAQDTLSGSSESKEQGHAGRARRVQRVHIYSKEPGSI